MKMAKASEADLDMAMELCSTIDALTGHWPTLPTGLCKTADDETFDCDDDRQCGTVLRHLLAIAERASLLRVVWGCAVMLDPRNKLVDPDADTIEHHPDRTMLLEALKDTEHAVGLLTKSAICEAVHHAKADQHGALSPCPVAARFVAAYDNASAAIAKATGGKP